MLCNINRYLDFRSSDFEIYFYIFKTMFYLLLPNYEIDQDKFEQSVSVIVTTTHNLSGLVFGNF